jgi:hypothetical protein
MPAPSSLTLLRERLPQISKDLARLFARDEDVRDLCEEYEACAITMARLDARDPALESMRNEYRSLQRRLEKELLRLVEEQARRES